MIEPSQNPIVLKQTPLSSGGNGGDDGIYGLAVRVAKLESDVHHIRNDMSEMKLDIREVKSKVQNIQIDVQKVEIHLRRTIDSSFKWLLKIYGAGFLILSGLMAHGFNWF